MNWLRYSHPGFRVVKVDRFSRTVLGYHGCRPSFADKVYQGEITVDQWRPSENTYDWIGHGIYFGEHAPARAANWRSRGGVIGAVINLGNCLDLTDIQYTQLLANEFNSLKIAYAESGVELPVNDDKLRTLDCLVINRLAKSAETDSIPFDTVRCPFLEGEPAFEGSRILSESHIQIVVRNKASIVGIFRPNPFPKGGDS
jgi:hypothetical protein